MPMCGETFVHSNSSHIYYLQKNKQNLGIVNKCTVATYAQLKPRVWNMEQIDGSSKQKIFSHYQPLQPAMEMDINKY